jgi:hypothetical protein
VLLTDYFAHTLTNLRFNAERTASLHPATKVRELWEAVLFRKGF